MNQEGNSGFVTKSWVIGVLCLIVGALAMTGITNVFGDAAEIKLKQDNFEKSTLMELSNTKERVSVLEAKIDFMVQALKEIREEVKK